MKTIIFGVCLVIMLWFSPVIIIKSFRKQAIHYWVLFLNAVSTAAVIMRFMGIW